MSSVLSSLPPRGGARARRTSSSPLGGKEERTDDISDYNKNYGKAFISGVTASLANSAINPIIYFYRNGFRQALKTY